MFIWGLLSLIQILFLPGFLLLHLFRVKHTRFPEKIVFSFAFSLIANFIIVLVLTSLGLYTRPIVLLLFFIELGATLLLSYKWLRSNRKLGLTQFLNRLKSYPNDLFAKQTDHETEGQRLLRIALFGLLLLGALAALGWITRILWDQKLTVFSVWDSVVSWNNWAVQWANNQFPEIPRRYGQLVPANWSLSYVFMDSEQVQFFAKSIMPLFTLFTLLLPVLLGIEFKSYGFLAAAIIIQFVYKEFLGVHVYSGYVDPAVAFFSFASIYCLLKASFLKEKKAFLAFIGLGAILAGGAFATKQTGLYILFFYPLLAYFLVLKPNKSIKLEEIKRGLIYPLGIALAFSVPWYVYTEVTIYLGLNKSEFEWILDEVHRGRSLWVRMTDAIASLQGYAVLFIVSLASIPLLPRILKWVTVAVVLPYSILWALYASYSQRNLALVFPILALISGAAIERMIVWAQTYFKPSWMKLALLASAVAVAGLGLVAAKSISDEKLIDIQVNLQKEILLRGLNRELYDYFESGGEPGMVLSGYPLEFLPGFEHLTISDSFEDYETYLSHLSQYPEIQYLLMPKAADDTIFNEVMAHIEAGSYGLIFEQNNFYFVRIKEAP